VDWKLALGFGCMGLSFGWAGGQPEDGVAIIRAVFDGGVVLRYRRRAWAARE
jgi:hypothetical protein